MESQSQPEHPHSRADFSKGTQQEAPLYHRRTGSNSLHMLDINFHTVSLDKASADQSRHQPPTPTNHRPPFSTPTGVLDYSEDLLEEGVTGDMLKGANSLALGMLSAAQKSTGRIRRQLILEAMNTFQEVLAVSPDDETAVSALALCLTELRDSK